ncbi:MAG: alpha/beta hydrolase [Ignavibacterium sp.]|nr:alpha/beta hydrolase [Ignavibacterium sp.]
MKNYFRNYLIILFFSLFQLNILAQSGNELTGIWEGNLVINPSVELPIVFRFEMTDEGGYECKMDSPSQSAKDIPTESVTFIDDSVIVDVKVVAGSFAGKIDWNASEITGKWSQSGQSFDLVIKKVEKVTEINRPQEPKEPFPYISENVFFENKTEKIFLAGTLTYPNEGSNFPTAVLISGSGPQNRDEELLGHKPFLVLSDHLTRNGFAVLRFDDRGVAESEGDFSSATSEDFAKDVLAAVEYLKTRNEIDHTKIGLIGHSEGGIIAPMAANQNDEIAFIVLLAGTGLPGEEILYLQSRLIEEAGGTAEEDIQKSLEFSSVIYDAIKNSGDLVVAEKRIKEHFWREYKEMTDEDKQKIGDPELFLDMQLRVALTPWFKFFLTYDPAPALEKIKCPVLAIIGEKDLQVPPKENLPAIEESLKRGGNKNFTVKELPGLNHLFQAAETGSPLEYGKIEETMSPAALDTITKWLHENIK